MKKSIWLGISACCCSLAFGVSLVDEFNDTEIDTSTWEVRLPFGDSTVTEHDGIVTIRHGGQLISTGVLSFPYEITGRLRIAGNSRDTLVLNFRSDGVSDPELSPNELINSLQIRFTKVTDPGALVNWIIAKDGTADQPLSDPDIGPYLALVTYPYDIGQWYDFKFRDDGLNFDFFLGDLSHPLISAVSTQPNGGSFAVYNRPGSGGGSSISEGSVIELDYIRSQSLSVAAPEGGATSCLLLLGFCGLALSGRKSTKPQNRTSPTEPQCADVISSPLRRYGFRSVRRRLACARLWQQHLDWRVPFKQARKLLMVSVTELAPHTFAVRSADTIILRLVS